MLCLRARAHSVRPSRRPVLFLWEFAAMRALPPAIMAYAHHHGIQPHTCSCHRTACARYDGKCSDSTELHTPQIIMKAFASPYMCSTDACVSSGERTCRSRAARKKAAWDTHLQLAMGGGLSSMARLTIWRLVSAPGSVALSTRYGGSSIECMGFTGSRRRTEAPILLLSRARPWCDPRSKRRGRRVAGHSKEGYNSFQMRLFKFQPLRHSLSLV